MKDKCGTKVV